MTLSFDSASRLYVAVDGSTFKAIRRGNGDVTGYIEVFKSRAAGFVTVPGQSRFINA